jgi:hypothetical protein
MLGVDRFRPAMARLQASAASPCPTPGPIPRLPPGGVRALPRNLPGLSGQVSGIEASAGRPAGALIAPITLKAGGSGGFHRVANEHLLPFIL